MHLPYPSFSIVVLVTRGFKNSEIVLFNSALPSNNTFAPVKTVKKTVDFSVLSLPGEEFGDGKKKKNSRSSPGPVSINLCQGTSGPLYPKT